MGASGWLVCRTDCQILGCVSGSRRNGQCENQEIGCSNSVSMRVVSRALRDRAYRNESGGIDFVILVLPKYAVGPSARVQCPESVLSGPQPLGAIRCPHCTRFDRPEVSSGNKPRHQFGCARVAVRRLRDRIGIGIRSDRRSCVPPEAACLAQTSVKDVAYVRDQNTGHMRTWYRIMHGLGRDGVLATHECRRITRCRVNDPKCVIAR